jgi:hypothetical protein
MPKEGPRGLSRMWLHAMVARAATERLIFF